MICERCEEAEATVDRFGEPLCEDCSQAANEHAAERQMSDFYGGETPQTDHERALAAYEWKVKHR